jgi:hypothetical protein
MNTGVPGQDFPGSDLGMAVQVVENRHGQETMHPMGTGFTLKKGQSHIKRVSPTYRHIFEF